MLKTTVEFTDRDGNTVKKSAMPSDSDCKMVAESLGWKENIPDPEAERIISAKRAEFHQLIADGKKGTTEFTKVAKELNLLEQNPPGKVLNPETEFEFLAKGLLRTGQQWYIDGKGKANAAARAEAEAAEQAELIAESETALNLSIE